MPKSDVPWLPPYAEPLLPAMIELSERLTEAVAELDRIYENLPPSERDQFAVKISTKKSLADELGDLACVTFQLFAFLPHPDLITKYPDRRVRARSRKYLAESDRSLLFAARFHPDSMLQLPISLEDAGRREQIRDLGSWETLSDLVDELGIPKETHDRGWPGALHVAEHFRGLKHAVAELADGLAPFSGSDRAAAHPADGGGGGELNRVTIPART